jgi:hypothetical protein
LLAHLLEGEADAVKCAATEPECTGPSKNNSYYGHGLVNALDAVR